jgi:hypothetical protein
LAFNPREEQMKRAWWAMAFVFALSQLVIGQQSVLDRTLDEDILGDPVVWVPSGINDGMLAARIAMSSRVPIVFEALAIDLVSPGTVQQRLVLRGMTVRDALQLLVTTDPRYQWIELDGVVVVRPVVATTDSMNPLNRQIGPIDWEGVTAEEALARTIALAANQAPPPGIESVVDRKLLSVRVSNGTILDVLLATARAHGEAVWSIPGIAGRARNGAWSVNLTTFDGRGVQKAVPLAASGQ